MPESLLTNPQTATPAEVAGKADLTTPVREFVAAINRKDVDGATAQLAPSALHHGRVSNYRPDGVNVLFTMLLDVFPDLQLDIATVKVEGNRVMSRIAATGTHTGSFLGKPATGEPMAWTSVDIAEISTDGRILKRFWDIWGDPELWKKIGFIPAIMC